MSPNQLREHLSRLHANATIVVALRCSPPITTKHFHLEGDTLILQAPARQGTGVERLNVDTMDILGITPTSAPLAA